MRTFICIVLAAMLAIVAAVPITPSAPRLQKRAEQFRLQGLKEFEIAERLSASAAESETFRTRVNHKFHSILHTPSAGYDHDLFLGDLAPGSLDSPSMLPTSSNDDRESFFRTICALFHERDRDSLGYEGKESELKRPTGVMHWTHSFGGFRR